VGPSLNGVVARRGADFVRRKLADPSFNTAVSMMPNFSLLPEDIEAIVAFLNVTR
jgi:cbb3-type cytochrome oxidase cytochrome c subunit